MTMLMKRRMAQTWMQSKGLRLQPWQRQQQWQGQWKGEKDGRLWSQLAHQQY